MIAALAKRALKAAAAVAPVGHRGVVVLIYHRVGSDGSEMTVAPSVLRDHLAQLAGSVGTLDQFVDPGAAARPFVVTVDDGTADFADALVPLLVEAGVPATLYLATDFVESQRPFPQQGRPLSWAALADCLDTGLVTVGSHTHTHALLDRAPIESVVRELDASIGLIEDRLGVTPRHFAYPKAVLGSHAAEAEVRRRFATASIAGTRPNVAGRTDVHRLARSPIQRSDSMAHFRRKAAGGMRLEDDVRRLANRVRYRGLTS